MASALTLSLPDELDEFVSRRVREEAYADAAEYLRALIRADRRRAVEEKLERLVEQALESGPPEALSDSDKILMIYTTDRGGIDILRVVHGARDVDALELDDT